MKSFIFFLVAVGIAVGIYFIATHDFCPLYYGVECAVDGNW